jgi:hypothetical protein
MLNGFMVYKTCGPRKIKKKIWWEILNGTPKIDAAFDPCSFSPDSLFNVLSLL